MKKLSFQDFIKTPNINSTKIKFHISDGKNGLDALDILINDENEWINMNAYRGANQDKQN